ncbi:MAG TPA: AI-2E family transporter [Candidatus Limnocylindrales bacterium]|nr:AI-2E family transporter [Candidatus Limnocylindrales bacterium]
MPIELTERQRRLIDAALILAVVALAFVVLSDMAGVFYAFGDVLLLFFLAWLLSFALLPLIRGVTAVVPRIPQAGAVIVVYLAIVVLLLAIVVQASASLASSIAQFIQDAPRFEDQLQNLLAQVQEQLIALGFQVDLVSQAPIIVENLQQSALQLVGPLQSLAFASIGVFGNVLLLVILSIYIAIDRAAIVAFLYRLVPPGFVTEARLLQTSVSRSFGGFLRGQLIMGAAFGAFTAVVNILFGLDYAALTTVTAGLLHAIPFFGPFVSWVPPVAVALLFDPGAVVPVLILMGISWFVTMNVLSPRLMSGAVGVHPIVVLASVVIGGKIAGIAGAIFGIPIAAVLSVFFFHWFGRSRENGTVTDRAAKRLAQREGRDVRRPREPVPGIDADVDEVVVPAVPAAPATAATTTAAPTTTTPAAEGER